MDYVVRDVPIGDWIGRLFEVETLVSVVPRPISRLEMEITSTKQLVLPSVLVTKPRLVGTGAGLASLTLPLLVSRERHSTSLPGISVSRIAWFVVDD